MRVEAIRAWPGRWESVLLDLPDTATVADALRLLPFDPAGCEGFAVHGVRVAADHPLRDRDRLELLRALLIDPKAARRRRATRSAT